MGSPTTFKMGPLTNGIIPSKAHALLMLFIAWASLLPPLVLACGYLAVATGWNPFQVQAVQAVLDWLAAFTPWDRVAAWLAFPFFLLLFFYSWAFCAIKIAKACLRVELWRHPVQEGIFPRDMHDDACYHWHARRAIKKFPCWLLQLVPFPWMKRSYIYNQLGARIGKNAGVLNAWIDVELVTIEDDAAIGRAAMISSHYFTPDHLIVKRVHVKKGAIVGERARITPGCTVGERAIIVAKSVVRMDETIPDDATLAGSPATPLDSRESPGQK